MASPGAARTRSARFGCGALGLSARDGLFSAHDADPVQPAQQGEQDHGDGTDDKALRADGQPRERQPGPRSAFWPAFEKWRAAHRPA